MIRVALGIIAASLLAASVARAEWTLFKLDGRDHVSLENVARFYGLGELRRVNNAAHLGAGRRSIRATANSQELYVNNIKFILSYPVQQQGDHLLISRMDLVKVIEPVLRPCRIKDAEQVDTIVLDAGHGGHDVGAISPYGYEKDFTLDVALRCRELLRLAGYRVHLTRSNDTFIPLHERARFANRFDRALFISIHFNHGQSSTATGFETFTLAPRGVPSMASDGPRVTDFQLCAGNARDAENMALACAAHSAMVTNLAGYDRGIKRARFVVIRDISVPGVLLEGGFLSNPAEARRIATPAYRQMFARSIATAVEAYRKAVGPAAAASAIGPLVQLRHPATPAAHADQDPNAAPTVITPTASRTPQLN